MNDKASLFESIIFRSYAENVNFAKIGKCLKYVRVNLEQIALECMGIPIVCIGIHSPRCTSILDL